MSFQEVLAVIVNRRSSSDTGHAFNRPRADTVRFDGIKRLQWQVWLWNAAAEYAD